AAGSSATLDGLLKVQDTRWLATNEQIPATPDEQAEYARQHEVLQNYLAALRAYDHYASALEQHLAGFDNLDDAGRLTLDDLSKSLAWPASLPLPATLAEVRKRLERAHRQATAKPEKERDTRTAGSKAVDIQPLFQALEEHRDLRQLRESRQAMRDLQTVFDSLDRKAADPWRNRLALLIGQLRELEDWQRFAVVPNLTALCEQTEGLAEHPQAAESQAAQIREFQQAWRDLG